MKKLLFIHGAWGGAWEFEEFIDPLSQQGLRAHAIDLLGHGQNEAPISEVTMEAYVSQVIEAAQAIDGPIILVGHSLAGAIISQVGERIPEKIERLVYVAASLPKNGESVIDLMSSDSDGKLLPQLVFSKDNSIATVQLQDIKALLLHDVKEAERVTSLAPKFEIPQATEPFMATIQLTEEAFGSIPKSYIRATLDKVMSTALQDRMISNGEVEQVFTLESGHFPMMSIPDHFIKVIIEIAVDRAVSA
jgi:pimeloyl-ACP methyl ester carboxylesterase